MRTRSDDLSATERCKAVEAAHRRPDGSAAGASTARTGSEVVRPRPAGSTLRWGFWGSARHLHVTSTCRRRGSAPRLHFTLAAPALISMLLRPHETHLIARVAQSRPESVPSSSSDVTRSPSIAHSSASAAAAKDRREVTYGEKEHGKMSQRGPLNAGWALLMVWKAYIGYNWVADSTVDMQLLTCRVDSASARGGACRWWSLVFHACGRVPAVHTCGEGKAGLGGHWGADLCWELSGQLSCGGSNRMWRMLHRIMLKFKSAL